MADHNGYRKKALVTGASRGIGRGVALALAEAGYELTISHFDDDEQAGQTAKLLERQGAPCTVIAGDLSEADVAQSTVNTAIQAMGRIDVLVNNAGVTLFEPVQQLSLERMDTLMRLNFQAPLLIMRDAARHMIAEGIRGSIVNITSSRAERAYPGDAVYGGLKAGLKRASEAAALDLAPYGIRVNCIAPGAVLVREPQERHAGLGAAVPLARMGLPEDIGRAAVWLVSEQADYITGTTLRVDGGLILPGMPEDGRSHWGARKPKT